MLRIFSLVVTAGYLAVWLCYLKLFLGEEDRKDKRILLLSVAAALLHAVYLGVMWCEMYHPPLTTTFEVVSTLALMLAVISIFLERRPDSGSTGFIVFFMVMGLQIVSTVFIGFKPAVPEVLNARLLFAHVGPALMGYTAFTVAFLYSVMYLLMHRELSSGKFGLFFRKLPSLEELDDMNFTAALIGEVFLLWAIFMGVFWSQVDLRTLHFLDPKVTISVLIWLVYLIVLVCKLSFGWQGKRIAIMSICGYILILVSMLVLVNMNPYSFH